MASTAVALRSDTFKWVFRMERLCVLPPMRVSESQSKIEANDFVSICGFGSGGAARHHTKAVDVESYSDLFGSCVRRLGTKWDAARRKTPSRF